MLRYCLILVALGGVSGAAGAADTPAAPAPSAEAASIGIAVMREDGTLVLRLRATLDGGAAHGESEFRYRPGTPEYAAVLAHIGGLAPGQSKAVPPWPEGE
ncbi:hypothetical protein [Luteimonas sp. RC10]|uniref:hypothetical protein n=1 Tax=Luteimonas sp. RC10 TaxID=2587035 RepID=UPI001608F87B|nr:hypothetical protein [Luteimonas sp. RC10]MBB3342617.1 hypothetical protein [Luteimonas sp. RC10]